VSRELAGVRPTFDHGRLRRLRHRIGLRLGRWRLGHGYRVGRWFGKGSRRHRGSRRKFRCGLRIGKGFRWRRLDLVGRGRRRNVLVAGLVTLVGRRFDGLLVEAPPAEETPSRSRVVEFVRH
jgi:hypothetical protein